MFKNLDLKSLFEWLQLLANIVLILSQLGPTFNTLGNYVGHKYFKMVNFIKTTLSRRR